MADTCFRLPRSHHHHLMKSTVLLLVGTLLLSGVRGLERFLVEPSSTEAVAGRTVVLYCQVGDRQGVVQWTKDEFALGSQRTLPGFPRYSMIGSDSQGQYNLQIQDVSLEDDGEYECQVGRTQASSGLRSRPATLNVMVPPQPPYIVGGTTVGVLLSRPSNVSCRADGGKPVADVTWYLEDVPVTRDVFRRATAHANKSVDTEGVVTLNASLQQAGQTLRCRVSHPALSQPVSTLATLDVQFPPNITMGLNLTRTIREYDFLRFVCTGHANPNIVTWRWYRNGDQVLGETRNMLDLPSISKEYNGDSIACEATNSVGSTRVTKELTVEYGPSFPSPPKHVAANVGEPARLVCRAEGNPPPSIIWTKRGSNRPLGSSEELFIRAVNQGDFGIYVCTATVLGFPDMQQLIYLLQNGPPKIVSERKQFASRGSTAQLECVAMSVPKPTDVTWYRHGEPINYAASRGRLAPISTDIAYGRNTTLQILNVGPDDYGVYNCTVDNGLPPPASLAIELAEPVTPPLPYIIGGVVGGVAVLFVLVLALVLFHRYRSNDTGSVLGSYADTESSGEKRGTRDKTESPSTLMGQWRADYNKDLCRLSADCEHLAYLPASAADSKANNNGYGWGEAARPKDVYRESPVFPASDFSSGYDAYGTGVSLSSFRGGDYADPARLPPADLSTTKLATNV